MAEQVNLARFYLKEAGALPVKLWVMDGTMPYPDWPDADAVFVLNPPPLDIPVLAEVWKHGRTLIVVSKTGDRSLTTQETHPLSEFFAILTVSEVLTHLRQRQRPVWFLSAQRRRPWHLNWLPTVERDALVIDSPHWVLRFEEYVPYEGSFEFDDTYRRLSLRECTFAQSTAHFLHVLETLPWTALAEPQLKRALFQGIFPFYTGAPLGPEVPFEWRGTPDALPRAILGSELRTHAVPYALALACLSEVAAAFTHRGRHDLYQAVMGESIHLHQGQVEVGTFTPEQRQWLRRTQPLLYLHVFYRVPNQFLVASIDAVRDALQHTDLSSAAEDLLHLVVT